MDFGGISSHFSSDLFSFQVYQQSIGGVCNIDWPRSKMLIQVLDDSDDRTTQLLNDSSSHLEIQKPFSNRGLKMLNQGRKMKMVTTLWFSFRFICAMKMRSLISESNAKILELRILALLKDGIKRQLKTLEQ